MLDVPIDSTLAVQRAARVMDEDGIARRRRLVDARTRKLRSDDAAVRQAALRKPPVDLAAASVRAARRGSVEQEEAGENEENEPQDGKSRMNMAPGNSAHDASGAQMRGARRNSVDARIAVARKERRRREAEARLDGGAARTVGVFRSLMRPPIVVYSQRRPLVGEGFQPGEHEEQKDGSGFSGPMGTVRRTSGMAGSVARGAGPDSESSSYVVGGAASKFDFATPRTYNREQLHTSALPRCVPSPPQGTTRPESSATG